MSSMPALSVAPMMDITDRHFRSFLRTLTRRTLLYTEMITEQAIRFGDAGRILAFDTAEEPLALQLGGSDPAGLAEATRIAFQAGYSEVNLNVGCPSSRVQSGRFGACLMLEPELVAELVSAMQSASPMPVTVKHRIGVDEQESFDELLHFVDTVAEAGVRRFSVHARKAWLKGLSPRENREIPPLNYAFVTRLATLRPQLEFELNGGVKSLDQASDILAATPVKGVMIGRAVVDDPWMLARADSRMFGQDDPVADPRQAVRDWLPYVDDRLQDGAPFSALIRPLLGMFGGQRGARAWRRHLSEAASQSSSDAGTIEAGLDLLPSHEAAVRAGQPQQQTVARR